MNYFRESLLFIPSSLPDLNFRPDFSLFSLEDILNEPVLPQDRRDINRIYEQTDLLTKRNSIVNMNNKKQKKLVNNGFNPPSFIPQPKVIKDEIIPPQQFQILGRQNAFFQEIHPSDVDKNNEENIFDYRLHIKLARGEEIFKVEELKRKTKKRNVAGKQCECCGKQVMKNHRCQHTLCEQKCGKVESGVNLKRSSKKDAGSSISDSKDLNWSDENINGEKTEKIPQNNRKESDKKSKQLNRRQSASSNKQKMGEPSQFLLASIQKLLSVENNNFTYKVLEIKEYESEEEDEQNRENFDDEKEIDMDDSQNKRLYEEDEIRDQENEEKMEIEEEKPQKMQKRIEVVIEQKRQEKGIIFTHSMLNIKEPVQKSELNNKATKIQPSQKQEKQSQSKRQSTEKKVPQGQKQSNSSQQRSTKADQSKQNSGLSGSEAKKIENPIKQVQMLGLPPSESESESNRPRDQEEPEIAEIGIENDSKKQNNNSSEWEMRNQDNQQGSKHVEESQNQRVPSVPSPRQENSLDDEIDSIIDPEEYDNQADDYTNKNHNPFKSPKESPQKFSKKQTKKIKTIQKKILMSEQIEDIDPISDPSDHQSDQNQASNLDQQSQNQDQGLGKGKCPGMGRGKAILEEQLEIEKENSKILRDYEDNEQNSENSENYEQQVSSQRKIGINTISSPKTHPLTPKRQIPNMQKIIKQIQIDSEQQKYEKGLGRGKIFGRGLGVLEQAEELQKQVEEDGLELEIEMEKPKKRVKISEQNETNKAKEKQENGEDQRQDDGDQDFMDKFAQLIQEQEVAVPETINMKKSSSIDKQEAQFYKLYLEKRESIAVGLGRIDDNDDQDENYIQEAFKNESEKENELEEGEGFVSRSQSKIGENEQSSSEKKGKQVQEEELEFMFNLGNENNGQNLQNSPELDQDE